MNKFIAKAAYQPPLCQAEKLCIESGIMNASDVSVNQINPQSPSIDSMDSDPKELTF